MKFTSGQIKHKFKAKCCTVDDIKFPSNLERDYYLYLKSMETTGMILFFLQQVPFRLPGGIKYFCDFQIFWAGGEVTFEETKGVITDVARIKMAQVEDLYPVKIKIVKRGDF